VKKIVVCKTMLLPFAIACSEQHTGDLAFDAPTNRDDFELAATLHRALPVPCRYLPGNHDIGDNPTAVGPPPQQPATEQDRQTFLSMFGEDRWRFEAAGWCFIGLNSLIMNTGLASENDQFDWLASQLALPAPSRSRYSCTNRCSWTRPAIPNLRQRQYVMFQCRREAACCKCLTPSITG
jgi:hypothetical protein